MVPHWKALGRMCWLCEVVGDPDHPLKYSRTDRHAPWRRTRQSHAAFLRWATTEGAGIAAFFRYCQGLGITSIMIDMLHTVDLGIFAHTLANIFWEVLSLKMWGSTQEENCCELHKLLKKFQSDNKIHNKWRGKFTCDKLKTKGGWPKLKCLAAIVRDLAPFGLELAEKYLDRKHRWLCQMMIRCYDIFDSEPLFLSPDAAEEIQKLGARFSDLYAEFAAKSFSRGIRSWKTSPKLHLFQHLCEWVAPEMGNPRFFWCYADEDMVGKMIVAAKSCHPRTLH